MSTTPTIPQSAAVIGCGKNVPGKVGWGQGRAHGDGYVQAFPGVALHAVDPSEENLRGFGEAFGLPESRLFRSTADLYARVRPEMVSIATWPALHLPQVLEAVAAGVKMIVCEKPLALDAGEIDQMLAACRNAGVRLAVAHQRRYDPRFELLRTLVRENAVGAKPVLYGRVGDGWDILSWTTHWFDMANFIFNATPVSLLAGVDHTGERRYNHAVENASVVFAEYPEGRQAIFVTGPDSAGGISIEGPDGYIRMTSEGAVVLTARGAREIAAPKLPDQRNRDYVRLFADMARAFAAGGDFRGDAVHTAWGTRMAYAAHESAVTQRTVKFPSAVKYAPLEVVQHRPVPGPDRRLRIGVLADAHHFDKEIGLSGRDGLLKALGTLGHEVSLAPVDEREIVPADLAEKDLLVIYHTKRKSSEETRRLVGDWIRSGNPTLVSHCGIGAWDWDEYRRWIGRYWVWADEDKARASHHPVEPCDIELDPKTTLWSAPWSRGWLPRDEVYTHLGEAGPVEDIAWAVLKGERHPFAWRSRTAPNVAVYLPGHRADIFEVPALRDGLAAMIGLVAGKK